MVVTGLLRLPAYQHDAAGRLNPGRAVFDVQPGIEPAIANPESPNRLLAPVQYLCEAPRMLRLPLNLG